MNKNENVVHKKYRFYHDFLNADWIGIIGGGNNMWCFEIVIWISKKLFTQKEMNLLGSRSNNFSLSRIFKTNKYGDKDNISLSPLIYH
jgi:hypothetical protein